MRLRPRRMRRCVRGISPSRRGLRSRCPENLARAAVLRLVRVAVLYGAAAAGPGRVPQLRWGRRAPPAVRVLSRARLRRPTAACQSWGTYSSSRRQAQLGRRGAAVRTFTGATRIWGSCCRLRECRPRHRGGCRALGCWPRAVRQWENASWISSSSVVSRSLRAAAGMSRERRAARACPVRERSSPVTRR